MTPTQVKQSLLRILNQAQEIAQRADLAIKNEHYLKDQKQFRESFVENIMFPAQELEAKCNSLDWWISHEDIKGEFDTIFGGFKELK